MGDEYRILVSQEVEARLSSLDDKSKRIVRENLQKLTQPIPGRGQGDKERLTHQSKEIFRLHIGRTWTAFYEIDEDEKVVKVLELFGIDEAHKRYGELG